MIGIQKRKKLLESFSNYGMNECCCGCVSKKIADNEGLSDYWDLTQYKNTIKKAEGGWWVIYINLDNFGGLNFTKQQYYKIQNGNIGNFPDYLTINDFLVTDFFGNPPYNIFPYMELSINCINYNPVTNHYFEPHCIDGILEELSNNIYPPGCVGILTYLENSYDSIFSKNVIMNSDSVGRWITTDPLYYGIGKFWEWDLIKDAYAKISICPNPSNFFSPNNFFTYSTEHINKTIDICQ